MNFDGLNRRLIDYQLSCGPVAVQVVSPFTGVGYSSNVEEIIAWADELDTDAVGASAIYTGVNPCTAHHLALVIGRAGAVWTKNADVTRRRAVFIDADVCDPSRPTGFCATDAEVQAANTVMDSVRDYLLAHGVSHKSMARAASGNGANTLLFVDWPCDARSDAAVTGVLRGLSKFNTPAAAIDVSVGDRRRIRKLYGCMTRKKKAPGRPWRRSGVVEMPELSAIELVPLELVERIVADLGGALDLAEQAARPSPTVPGSIARQIALLERWADAYGFPGILFVKSPDAKGAVTVVLECCPRNPDHTGTSAGLIFFPDGGRGCCCHHNSCRSLTFKQWWAEVEVLHGRTLKFERELIRR